MRKFKILIIDDGDQSDELDALKIKLKKEGVDLESKQFSIGSSRLEELNTDNKLDLDKIKGYYHDNFHGKIRFDLICFDYELGDENITGVEVLTAIRPFFADTKTKTLFYSSKLDTIISRIINSSISSGGDNVTVVKEAKKKIKSLINSKVEGFVSREAWQDKAIEIIKKPRVTLDELFIDELSQYSSYSSDFFDDMIVYDIEELFDTIDDRALKFKKEIVKLLVAFILKVKEGEDE